MKQKDLISVIVPVYKVEKYIKRCINSVLKQSYNNIEIIIINDGSPDKCPEICEDLKKQDKRISVIHKENEGLSAARNDGIKIAKGRYICFIDSDDYVEKDYIKKLYEKIKKDKCDIAICGYNRIYDDKIMNCKINEFNINNFITPAAWNKLYKKELFDNIQFPVGLYYEDLGTTSKILMSNIKYTITDDYLYNYVQNNNSIMHKSNDKIFDIYQIMDDITEYSKKNNCYQEYYSNLEMAHIFHILIGTSYRAASHENFNYKMIKNIYEKVSFKFPKWYKNKQIKKLNILYRFFLILYKYKLFYIVYILLKLFSKRIYKYR